MQRSKIAFLSALFIPLTALAGQVYEWKDSAGKTHYSDRPPAGVNAKATQFRTGAAKPPPAAPAAGGQGAPQTWAERLKQLNEKQAEKQKQEADTKQKAEEDKRRQEACELAKRQKQMLESGQRVRRVNENGESVVLDDAGRAEEIARMEQDIARACSQPK